MASAYLIHIDPIGGYGNPDGMAQYAQRVREIVEAFGGTYRLRHREIRVLEGPWDRDYMTLIEFPSMSRLMEFYESEEYRPWLELRKNAGEGDLIAAEG
ncbi:MULTISPECIES: DUF1330 domain-containing protein [Mycolicibacterium]|uniref:DUF1330 domain-containing protein n=1 Tax=Mycolicibacterium wolinskyi TaxID=59750 RepID=A0A1X2FK53_9MYCO|nr:MULTISPECIES: DUF1330 domain-containing protein [Mycolicibacterium]MCV7289438.1 DUF1330 domain-containing protein [Mycolicibacterium wolinskyi]MCV7297431.1 DUF1330 domain-containing protein [Mycolicibacterium goodii]ORX18796.1 hypothetical protein AWC31_12545 [Mycolicibacterium wolinskyi]